VCVADEEGGASKESEVMQARDRYTQQEAEGVNI
jgi:hypothetical protein